MATINAGRLKENFAWPNNLQKRVSNSSLAIKNNYIVKIHIQLRRIFLLLAERNKMILLIVHKMHSSEKKAGDFLLRLKCHV